MGNCIQKNHVDEMGRRAEKQFKLIADQYENWDQLTDALYVEQKLEVAQLSIFVDFTQSNKWTGKRTNGGLNLHHPYISADEVGDQKVPIYQASAPTVPPPQYSSYQTGEQDGIQPGTGSTQYDAYTPVKTAPLHRMGTMTDYTQLNQYEYVFHVASKPLRKMDKDGFIPLYAFGDEISNDRAVRSMFGVETDMDHQSVQSGLINPEEGCVGLEAVIGMYRQRAPRMVLSGGTSFAPAVRQLIAQAQESKEYQIGIIITDGQISEGKCWRETLRAISDASHHPISIIIVGVGDGDSPKDKQGKYWRIMEDFDDNFDELAEKEGVPKRKFDNIQFVDSVKLRQECARSRNPEVRFATHMLMEIPDQWEYIKRFILPNYGR